MRRMFVTVGLTAMLAALIAGGAWTLWPSEASANQCASACYAAHNQCRVASKGSPSCDAQLSRCLAGCGRK